MAQEANRPANTPKLAEEARDLVLRLTDLLTATSERIAASRQMVGRLDSIEHHDAPHTGRDSANAAGQRADANPPGASSD